MSNDNSAELEWRWCIVGNIVDERECGEAHEIRRGIKNFRPGARVYINLVYGGMCHERILVIGVPRHCPRYIETVIRREYVRNFRIRRVFKPAVLKSMDKSAWDWQGKTDGDYARLLQDLEWLKSKEDYNMEIINFFESENKPHWIAEIKKSDWGAAPTLTGFLENGTFFENLGDGALFLLTDGDRLASFVTLAQRDCVDDRSLYPWIGFVFTFPEYRGHRCAGRLIGHCEELARAHGAKNVYICTDHIGLYEKYGYSYLENRVSIYGDDSRIYVKKL